MRQRPFLLSLSQRYLNNELGPTAILSRKEDFISPSGDAGCLALHSSGDSREHPKLQAPPTPLPNWNRQRRCARQSRQPPPIGVTQSKTLSDGRSAVKPSKLNITVSSQVRLSQITAEKCWRVEVPSRPSHTQNQSSPSASHSPPVPSKRPSLSLSFL